MISRSYTDNINMLRESADAYKHVTHHDLNLSTTENYFIWARPWRSFGDYRSEGFQITSPVDESLWVGSVHQVVDSLNRFNSWKDTVGRLMNRHGVRSYGDIPIGDTERDNRWREQSLTNPIAVFSIKTGELLWHDPDQYNEVQMEGHGYGVKQDLLGIPRKGREQKYGLSNNGVRPVIVIPKSSDEKLRTWERIIFHNVPASMKAKAGRSHGSVPSFNKITYVSHPSEALSFSSLDRDVEIDAANQMLQDGYTIDVIARTIIQDNYLKQIIAHIDSENQPGKDGEDITPKTGHFTSKEYRLGGAASTLTPNPNTYTVPSWSVENSYSLFRKTIELFGSAIAYNDIWVNSLPLTTNKQLVSLSAAMRSQSHHAQDYYYDGKPRWIAIIIDGNDEILWGFKIHTFTKNHGGHPQSRIYVHFNFDKMPSKGSDPSWEVLAKEMNTTFMIATVEKAGVSPGDLDGETAWFTIFETAGEDSTDSVNDGTTVNKKEADAFVLYLKKLFAGVLEDPVADMDHDDPPPM